MGSEGRSAVHLRGIYAAVERDHPSLVDTESRFRPGGPVEARAAMGVETLVVNGELRRRKDLGRGIYSL